MLNYWRQPIPEPSPALLNDLVKPAGCLPIQKAKHSFAILPANGWDCVMSATIPRHPIFTRSTTGILKLRLSLKANRFSAKSCINAVHEKESDKVRGDHFRKVKVPAGINRGGIITQASILTTTSNGTRTSPVKRGTWILKNLLDMDPGLPVANVGDIAPKVPGIDKATVRKRLEIHRSLEQCARCHNKIDPLGFALENFNAAGEWRDREGFGYRGRIERNDPLIDASSEMIDGTKIVGVAGLQNALLAQEELFLRCLTGKLITYAMGREMGLADQPLIIAAANHMKQNGYTLRSLVEFITMSNEFANR